MCKIISFTNSSKLDIRKTSEAIGKILLAIEQDGFGYAVQGAQNVFGEKCIAKKFTSRLGVDNLVDLPIIQKRQETFGYIDKPIGAAIFHGRTSTNDLGLINCHPMQKNNWHLIHNGVVNDNGEKYAKTTSNDSEDLLHRLILGIEQVEAHLSGYYAFCAIAPDGLLHVARDNQASLYIAKVPKINSYIIATTEDLIETTCKALKLKHGAIDKIDDNTYMIFNGNDLVSQKTIKPLGFDYRQSALATKSLGREIGNSRRSFDRSYDLSDLRTYGETYDPYSGESILDAIGETSDDIDGQYLLDLERELEQVDDTYIIHDYNNRKISSIDFHKLDRISQAECEIRRADGTYLDIPDSMLNEVG